MVGVKQRVGPPAHTHTYSNCRTIKTKCCQRTWQVLGHAVFCTSEGKAQPIETVQPSFLSTPRIFTGTEKEGINEKNYADNTILMIRSAPCTAVTCTNDIGKRHHNTKYVLFCVHDIVTKNNAHTNVRDVFRSKLHWAYPQQLTSAN